MKLYTRQRGTNQYKQKATILAARIDTWRAAYWMTVFGIFSIGICGFIKAVWDDNQAYRNFSLPISPLALVRDVAYAETPKIGSQKHITPVSLILSKKHGDIIYRIWNLESSMGEHGFQYCQKRGKVNDFGMGVLNTPPMCFDNFEQEVNVVSDWFDTQLQTKSLAQALCYYNEGKVITTCRYAQDFLQY